MGCMGNCGEFGPPPDTILSMPPPPLPSFLLPRSIIITPVENETRPCFVAFMCESNAQLKDKDFIELSGNDQIVLEYTWLLVLFASCIGIIFLAALLTVIIMKWRDFCGFSYPYPDNNMKQSTMSALGANTKSNPFMSTGIFYPCTSTKKTTLQQQLANENRLLWATLTPHGTRHFVSNFPEQSAGNHYETINCNKINDQTTITNGTPVKSFDNGGFIDYIYEDPTPLMDSYHDELDSGYQEPQEIIDSLSKNNTTLRPTVSSPTQIENPHIPPLNAFPHRTTTLSSSATTTTGTLNSRKSTLSRRISDTSTFNLHNI